MKGALAPFNIFNINYDWINKCFKQYLVRGGGFQPITKEDYFGDNTVYSFDLSNANSVSTGLTGDLYNWRAWFTGTINGLPYDGPVIILVKDYSTDYPYTRGYFSQFLSGYVTQHSSQTVYGEFGFCTPALSNSYDESASYYETTYANNIIANGTIYLSNVSV